MTYPLPTIPPSPTLPYGTSAGSIKKDSNVFRPGTAAILTTIPGVSPAVTTAEGVMVKALYNGTDEEVARILAGVDETNDGKPLSATFRRGLKDILFAAGYLSKSDYVPSAQFGSADYAAMRELLQEANYLGGYNWRQAIGLISDQIAEQGMAGGRKTSTYTQYSLSNEEDAEIAVNAALNNFLGRGATKQEKATLAKALRKYEQETPTVTTTTSGGGSTVSTSTSGASAAGRQQAILESLSQPQRKEMRAVVNTQLGERFSEMLRNA